MQAIVARHRAMEEAAFDDQAQQVKRERGRERGRKRGREGGRGREREREETHDLQGRYRGTSLIRNCLPPRTLQ